MRRSTCINCATPLAHHGEAGWRHELGFHYRNQCTDPVPAREWTDDG